MNSFLLIMSLCGRVMRDFGQWNRIGHGCESLTRNQNIVNNLNENPISQKLHFLVEFFFPRMPTGKRGKTNIKLQIYAIHPFAFADPCLEKEYQTWTIHTGVERFKPAMVYFWLPYEFVSKVALYPIRYFGQYSWSFSEAVVSFSRLVLNVFGLMIYFAGLNSKHKVAAGYIQLYFVRLSYLLAAAVQAGVKQHDSIALVSLVWVQYFSGVISPTFTEYLTAAITIAAIKPIRLLAWRSSCDINERSDELTRTVFLHHVLLLTMAIFINAHLHSHRRRAWLREHTTPADRAELSQREPETLLSSPPRDGNRSEPSAGSHSAAVAASTTETPSAASSTAKPPDSDAIGHLRDCSEIETEIGNAGSDPCPARLAAATPGLWARLMAAPALAWEGREADVAAEADFVREWRGSAAGCTAAFGLACVPVGCVRGCVRVCVS